MSQPGSCNAASDRFAAKQTKVDLARVAGQLRREPQEPEAERLGLRRPPGTGEEVFAKRVERLAGHDGEARQQGVAAELAQGRPAGRQPGRFLDPLLDYGTPCVEAPERIASGPSLLWVGVLRFGNVSIVHSGRLAVNLRHGKWPGPSELNNAIRPKRHRPVLPAGARRPGETSAPRP